MGAGNVENYRKAVPVARKHGLEVYAWWWTINNGNLAKEHPEWLDYNRKGESLADTKAYVDYYKFLCPAIPEVREYVCKEVDELCQIEGLGGVAIDYHRAVDVILPTTLWSRYDVVQDKEYPEFDYGYHPAMIEKFKKEFGYDPREQEDPSKDEKWRQFRCDQISEVANLIAEVVHSHGKMMSGSPFPTPKMSARMVRQDWSKWNMDIVFPMVYHDAYTEDPSFITDCTIANVKEKNPNTTLFCGMSLPYNGRDMIASMDAALKNGAQGIAFFTWNGINTPAKKAQFKDYADKARAARAANGGVVKATYPSAPETDHFKHYGVMRIIEERMQKSIAKAKNTERMAPLDLSEYKLVDTYDVTKVYEVTDKLSGKSFQVNFYFYGDVLSGWNLYDK